MRILVCAATIAESTACKAGIQAAGAIQNQFKVLKTGMGMAAAGKALSEHLASQKVKPDLIVSSGFAGVWRGENSVGDWIASDRIWREQEDHDLTALSFKKGKSPAKSNCTLVSVEQIQPIPLGLPSELSEGPLAVDMESAALAEVAEKNGIPFSVFRLITDTPESPLPSYVSLLSSAILSKSWKSKLWLTGQGLLEAIEDYKSVPGFLKSGKTWAESLTRGWRENAQGFLD